MQIVLNQKPSYLSEVAWLFYLGEGGGILKKILMFLCAMLLVFAITGTTRADLILFEDFEDSSGFTLAGAVPLYWGTAPLSGTTSIPSQFQQGSSSQDGNIFYGSLAKENSSSPAATMMVHSIGKFRTTLRMNVW